MLLTGQRVLVVEPEAFAAYALERRLRDLDADDVVLVSEPQQLGAADAALKGVRMAVIDMDESVEAAERLASELGRRGIRVVRTTRHDGFDDAVRKPYDMIDMERAIGRLCGIVI